MIQSNELRIGDYVKVYLGVNYLGADYKVHKIENFYENGVHIGFGKCFKFSEIEPITITEEWLVKFGFENHENYFWYKKENIFSNMLSVGIQNKDGVITIIENIKYLHQLQNLYFALTGKELDYDPNR